MSIIIGLPFLIIVSFILIVFFKRKEKLMLKCLVVLWVSPIILFVIGGILENLRKPIKLNREIITGNYRIDKKFYPGKNAEWQYDHFRFSNTPSDSIFFYITNADTVIRTIAARIDYSTEKEFLWKIQGDSLHHVIEYQPTLFRSHKRFYYVFRSDKYGNMFFRKE